MVSCRIAHIVNEKHRRLVVQPRPLSRYKSLLQMCRARTWRNRGHAGPQSDMRQRNVCLVKGVDTRVTSRACVQVSLFCHVGRHHDSAEEDVTAARDKKHKLDVNAMSVPARAAISPQQRLCFSCRSTRLHVARAVPCHGKTDV